jgi:hypothetical protein
VMGLLSHQLNTYKSYSFHDGITYGQLVNWCLFQ